MLVRYQVLRDNREKTGWEWGVSSKCSGTTERKLKVADYSLEGWENVILIERKGTTMDLHRTLCESSRWERFQRQLKRMDRVDHPYLILEFNRTTLEKFPVCSGYSHRDFPRVRTELDLMKSRLELIQRDHKVKVVFAGDGGGKDFVTELFNELFFSQSKPRTVAV